MSTEKSPDWIPVKKINFRECCCPVCGSSNASLKHKKTIREDTMFYYICNDCDLLYANPRATPESLKNIYASADFFQGGEEGGDHLNYADFIGGEEYLRMTARDRLKRISQYRSSGKMLEVASAAGFFLIESKLAGYDVSGIEISRPMAEWSSEKWDVPVRAESIEESDLSDQTYDLICSWGVMTIIQDPVSLIRKFHKALKSGGIWAFNTYYHDGIWATLMQSRWNILVVNFSQIYSQKLILDMIQKEGFELISCRREKPYTDLMKVADMMAWNLKAPWLPKMVRFTGLSRMIVKLPLPDVKEYIWRKI
jgi:2-polyprenyl-3-methyl-5-hydroxy-6-metoxy-1,4-benzoquinol methylase